MRSFAFTFVSLLKMNSFEDFFVTIELFSMNLIWSVSKTTQHTKTLLDMSGPLFNMPTNQTEPRPSLHRRCVLPGSPSLKGYPLVPRAYGYYCVPKLHAREHFQSLTPTKPTKEGPNYLY
jgi:hypothetical protein